MTDASKHRSPLDPSGDVSVVIVLYRTPEVIRTCLESFETYRPKRVGEVVVIDNSADGSSADLAERFSWVDYVENDENRHFRGACNQGAARARLHYLLFLNPDTYLVDDQAVRKLADVLDADARVGMVGPMLKGDDGGLAPQGESVAGLRHLFADRSGLSALWPRNPLGRRKPPPAAARHEAGYVDTVTAAALLCRRAEFLKVGGFDERVRMYWEEHELARKLAQHGLRGYYNPDAFIYHSWRKGGSEHEPSVAAYFEQAAANYYSSHFGLRGKALYRTLAVVRRTAKKLVR
jgi:N-acetylglucosaminyl-diphospho-decaprenol L-rhamnosyltransferase